MKFAILGLVLAATPAALPAQILWEQARLGMRAEEVRALYPNVAVPETDSILKGGARCELAISPHVVASHPYRVCFYFLNDRLEQVTLGSLEPGGRAFSAIVERLRTAHGPELGAGQPLCKFDGYCMAEWALEEGRKVSTLLVLMPMVPPTININYQAEPAK